MVGSRRVSETVRESVKQAGTLLTATLLIASAALVIAVTALVLVLRKAGN